MQAVCQTILIISKGRLVACDTAQNLERLFAGTSSVELTVEAPAGRAQELLSGLAGVSALRTQPLGEDRCGVTLDGDVVSSTRIRKLIADGDMEEANRLLGHPHCLVDTVHYGFQLGGKLGTPTINMRFAEGVLVPRHGVYAAKVFLDNGAEHMAVTNVGVRPTVSGSDRVSVESYILDFEGDLYDHTVRVEFHHFIRDERKFSGVDELKAQILRDAETTREYFAKA